FAIWLVISFCRANRSLVSRPNRSAQRCASVAASISWALTRSWLPDRLTLPPAEEAIAAAGDRLDTAASRSPLGTVKLAESRLGKSRVGRVKGRDEDASRPDLRRPSLPRWDHQLRGMAVFSVPVEPAHGRGDAGRPRYLGDARDDPAMGPQIRPGIRQPHPSASASPWRQMAPR